MISKKKIIENRVVLILSELSESFVILRTIERVSIKKSLLAFMKSVRYFFQVLLNLEFSQHVFERQSNIKFNENSSSGSRDVACGRTDGQTYGWTDRHDEANNHFCQFCESAYKLRHTSLYFEMRIEITFFTIRLCCYSNNV